jgi:hypothetical protein
MRKNLHAVVHQSWFCLKHTFPFDEDSALCTSGELRGGIALTAFYRRERKY